MSIQRATINELNFLTELFDSYRVFYQQESNLDGARNFLKERLENEDSVVFIAYDEGNPSRICSAISDLFICKYETFMGIKRFICT